MEVESGLEQQFELGSNFVAKEEVSKLKKQVEKISLGVQELTKDHRFKIDRAAKAIKRMEEVQTHLRQEMAQQYAEVSGKVHERRISEGKIMDLIDRHNSVVKSFENRLEKMKRHMEEREIRFLQTKAELEEAYRELQRLKRLK